MFGIIIRTVIMYILITFAIRIMGKRQIGDMQPNELVITMLISELAAVPIQDTNQPVLLGLIPILVLVVLEISASVLIMKCGTVRKLMNGKSAVIIKNGVIDQQTMRDVRMTVLDLVELLRNKDVFKIEDVAFAVLEVNGELSVLLKTENQPATKKDISANYEKTGLPLPVISDGKILKESLHSLNIDNKKFKDFLAKKQIITSDVFLLTMDRYYNYSLISKEKKI
ncbi:MAG TPA: DUF421 domain-containing protein [Ruminococcaceae bacterium]|nr:DUF421 domain-containing protein [Oscillospiraceae bacterium]